MKRLHVSVAVSDLDKSIHFYSTLFNSAPNVRRPDYAKWMLDDPRINFVIESRGAREGVDHLGIQVDDDAELAEVADRLKRAGQSVFEQTGATCCYFRSNKAWAHDPQGVAWETFHTFDTSEVYGDDMAVRAAPEEACCADEPCGISPAEATQRASSIACCTPTA